MRGELGGVLLLFPSPSCNEVCILLPILAREEAACLQDIGQGGVGRLLHHKEERRRTIKYTSYSLSSSHPYNGGGGILTVLHYVQEDNA